MIINPLQESIVERTRQIDNLLFKLGGRGRNLRERAHSVRAILDEHDLRHIARIVAVNRGMVYEADFRIEGDPQWFLAACDRLIGRLEGQLASRGTVQSWDAEPAASQSHRFASACAMVAAFLIAAVLFANAGGRAGWSHRPILVGVEFLTIFVVTLILTRRLAARRRQRVGRISPAGVNVPC